jgi:hypothetical protein
LQSFVGSKGASYLDFFGEAAIAGQEKSEMEGAEVLSRWTKVDVKVKGVIL